MLRSRMILLGGVATLVAAVAAGAGEPGNPTPPPRHLLGWVGNTDGIGKTRESMELAIQQLR